jgi:DNA-binding MarR family transcriptional regulator
MTRHASLSRTKPRNSSVLRRKHGLTPQQYVLLLGIAGYTGRGWATIGELAEFMQGRHNAVVGLVQRACRKGLVQKEHRGGDHRFVRVRLTRQGTTTLNRLAGLHMEELKRIQPDIGNALKAKPQFIKAAEGA